MTDDLTNANPSTPTVPAEQTPATGATVPFSNGTEVSDMEEHKTILGALRTFIKHLARVAKKDEQKFIDWVKKEL